MAYKERHNRRYKKQNIYGDINAEEAEDVEEMYDQYLMIYLLASNDGGLKII